MSWRVLASVAAVLILSMSTWFSATAIAPDLRTQFALTGNGAAWLTNAVQLGFVTGALALSFTGFADAWSARVIVSAAALLAALSNLAILAAPNVGALLAARFVTGVALAGVYPPALKLISSWFVTARGLAMGLAIGALTLGSSMPYLVRATGGSLDWRLVVVSASGAATFAAILILSATEGPHAGSRPKASMDRLGAVLRDPALWLANLGYFGHMWELYAMWGWFLAFAGHVAKSGPMGPPMLTFVTIATGVFGCLLGGVLGDRIGRTATAAGMMLVSGACAVGIGFAASGPAWLFVAVALVWGVAIIGDSAQFSAMVTELAEPDATGAAIALQTGIGYAVTVAAIRIVPAIAERIGWQWSFLVLAPGPFIGALAMLALRRLPRASGIAGGQR